VTLVPIQLRLPCAQPVLPITPLSLEVTPLHLRMQNHRGDIHYVVIEALVVLVELFFYIHTAFKLSSLWHVGYVLDDLYGF
jgi:hypothetical protein